MENHVHKEAIQDSNSKNISQTQLMCYLNGQSTSIIITAIRQVLLFILSPAMWTIPVAPQDSELCHEHFSND